MEGLSFPAGRWGNLLAASGTHCCSKALHDSFGTIPVNAGWWPLDCDWQHHLFRGGSTTSKKDLMSQRQRFLKTCEAWRTEVTGKDGQIGSSSGAVSAEVLTARSWRKQSNATWASDLIDVALPFFPYGQVTWPQFAALVVQRRLCEDWNRDGRVAEVEAWLCAGANFTSCDCLMVIEHNLALLFGDVPVRAATPKVQVEQLMRPFGQWLSQPQRTEHFQVLGHAGRHELWGRFVFRQNLTKLKDVEEVLKEQRAFGRSMMQAAGKVSEFLVGQPSPSELLDFTGQVRKRVPDPKRKRWGERRTGRSNSAIVTPCSGAKVYPALWQQALLRRVARGRAPFFAPGGDRNSGSVLDRVLACGATMSSVELPWSDCTKVITTLGANLSSENGWEVSGVWRDGPRCMVVLNRAVGRSVLDGFLLGEECAHWYGMSGADLSVHLQKSRLHPLMVHSSPLAIDIVERTLLDSELRNYFATMTELRVAQKKGKSCRSASSSERIAPRAALVKLQQHVAKIYWYVLNMMPYVRGSSTAALLLHHALWMAPFASRDLGHRALTRCLPMFKPQRLPDWDALATPIDEFVNETWWELFEERVELACFEKILRSEASEFAASA